MLSVAKLTPGQEGYYERSVAAGLDDYYAGRGESPGVWAGRGAQALELEGVVAGGRARAADPRPPSAHRRAAARRIRRRAADHDRADRPAQRRARVIEMKKLAPVAGFDLVFSPPKSVSLLHALGDEETRRAVNEAHLSAWQAALAYLEDEACVTRRGRNGVHREHAGGFVAAAYQHRTSRAQDPHLHTHVIVANMAKSPSDGKWRALDGEPILKSYRLAAGYLYQAQLRAELTRTLGVEWEQPRKGMAELRGVPRAVIREFSTRRAQVVEELARRGGGGFYAAQVAALETRERKEHVDLSALREDWRARAAEHGLGDRELQALLGAIHQRERFRATNCCGSPGGMLGPEGLTEKQTAFSEPEAVMAWAQAHAYRRAPPTASGGSRRASSAPTASSRSARLRVRAARPATRPPSWSLSSSAALALVERGRDADAPSISRAAPRRDRARRPDRPLRRAGGDGRAKSRRAASRVICVVGLAGAGKTTATHAVAQVFAQAGIPVLGAAPSGVAAEKLQDETGIPSTTLHRLLDEARNDGGLPHRCRARRRRGRRWPRRASSRPCSSSSSRRKGRRS